mmetsp:Transcript_6954/g.17779  ORF Transcript_6954/g.17779 Transcript_6954/m.17779 type:complete len:366 (+) Transcript_6954:3-1100(+)
MVLTRTTLLILLVPAGMGKPLEQLCRSIPKTELHVHLEGSLQPNVVRKIAQRNGKLSELPPEAEMFASYEKYDSLEQFLEVYYQGASVLQTKADFYDMTYDYIKRAAADGVVHIEPFLDLDSHTSNGVTPATVLEGVGSALADAERDFGVTSGLIVCFQRPRGVESALKSLDDLKPHIETARIVGVGCDSDYVDDWPNLYKPAYEKAHAMGLKLVAHAGEVADGARSIDHMRDAIKVLGLDRVDHGVRAWEDPELLADVAKRGIPLTSCPLSNIKLGLFGDWPSCAKAYGTLIKAGAKVTINSDDPAFFGTIAENFVALQQHLELSAEDVAALCKNAALGSFASEERKAALCNSIDEAVKAYRTA